MFARKTKQSVLAAAVLMLGLTYVPLCYAACPLAVAAGLEPPSPKDPLVRLLAAQDSCPKSPMEFMEALKRAGARSDPTMVNFAGFHNADTGSFFIFEIASSVGASPSGLTIPRGDLLFGHFAFPSDDGRLVSNKDGLAIELIVWDPDKQFYNFYELLNGNWAYRGDSKAILEEVTHVHRHRDGQAPFGHGLRCSGCHVNGGLIQKELAPPHNDWFVQNRKLPLGKLKPDAFVQGRLAEMLDAEELSKQVKGSAQRLADSEKYQKVLAGRTMQEQLRPLFCPMELNIESDLQPVDDRNRALRVPAAFFVDPRLATADISIDRQHYDAAVGKLNSRLPNTPGRADADHGWLTPVKANSDIVAVETLIKHGTVTREFAIAVLAVDFTNPVFSKTRCDLLKLVPDQGGPDFVTRFQGALRGSGGTAPIELLNNLSDPSRNAAFHQKQATEFVQTCQKRAADADAVLGWYRLLAQRRVEVSQSDISKNPKGHILEDEADDSGRTVFPSTKPAAVAGRLALTLDWEAK
jgi:hypothetical protein